MGRGKHEQRVGHRLKILSDRQKLEALRDARTVERPVEKEMNRGQLGGTAEGIT